MASAALGVSLTISLIVAVLSVLLGWLHTMYGYSEFASKRILFPILTYVITILVSSTVQFLVCKSINIKQIALTSLILPGAVLVSLIATLSSFIRSPIEVVVPAQQRQLYGPLLANAFYAFWASMIGGTFHASFTAAC